jgi:hypothetical protein
LACFSSTDVFCSWRKNCCFVFGWCFTLVWWLAGYVSAQWFFALVWWWWLWGHMWMPKGVP